MEEGALRYLDKIDKMGGVVKGIETGFFQKEIADSAYNYQKDIEKGNKIIAGVNEYQTEDKWIPVELLRVNPEVENIQIDRVKTLKNERDNGKVKDSLARLRRDIDSNANLMPAMIEAVKSYATLGEICSLLKEMYGDYQELIVI
jgi:methylmalonyl-CoA mutase N-terminal domain/subunit